MQRRSTPAGTTLLRRPAGFVRRKGKDGDDRADRTALGHFVRGRVANGFTPTPGQVAQLQRDYGNTTTARLLQPAVQRTALEDSTTEGDRAGLRILTAEGVKTMSAEEIRAAFKSKDKSSVPVDDTKFDAAIGAKVQDGLKTIAGEIFNSESFTWNTVTHLGLDLRPYGGANAVYRFTLVRRKAAPKTQLVIEQVGTRSGPLDKVAVKKEEARFAKLDFSWGTDFGTDASKQQLYTALARLPDSMLEHIRGVKFSRRLAEAGDKNEAGHYDPNTHTIVLFGSSQTDMVNSVDAGAATHFTFVVSHEVSHAVDFQAYTEARITRDALAKQLKEARLEERRVDPSTAGIDERGDVEKKKAQRDKIKQLEADLDKAEAAFPKASAGLEDGKSQHSHSKAYKDAKGPAISTYGGTDVVENFAESLSIYVLDPDLLKSLRPKAYAYFKKTFG